MQRDSDIAMGKGARPFRFLGTARPADGLGTPSRTRKPPPSFRPVQSVQSGRPCRRSVGVAFESTWVESCRSWHSAQALHAMLIGFIRCKIHVRRDRIKRSAGAQSILAACDASPPSLATANGGV